MEAEDADKSADINCWLQVAEQMQWQQKMKEQDEWMYS